MLNKAGQKDYARFGAQVLTFTALIGSAGCINSSAPVSVGPATGPVTADAAPPPAMVCPDCPPADPRCDCPSEPQPPAAPAGCGCDPDELMCVMRCARRASQLWEKGARTPPPDLCAGPSHAEPLCNPELAAARAPASFRVKFVTTKGDFVVQATRSWAPHGVDRLYTLVTIGYFNDIALFRVSPGFVVQFGIHGSPRLGRIWADAKIPDDLVRKSNARGMVSFAKVGPNTRASQLFISLKDNSQLDTQGFAPIGQVVQGMEVVESFYSGYGDTTAGKQGIIIVHGNRYLRATYPFLDYIKSAELFP